MVLLKRFWFIQVDRFRIHTSQLKTCSYTCFLYVHVSFVRPHSIYMNKKCINHAVWEPWALSHRHQRCNKQQSRRWKHHGFTAPTGYVIYFALSKSLISCSHVWKIRITKKIKHLVLDPQEVKHYLPASWKACTSNPPRIHKQHEPIVGSAPTKAAEWKISHIYICLLLASAHGVNEWSTVADVWNKYEVGAFSGPGFE